jgi:hypothetical protein
MCWFKFPNLLNIEAPIFIDPITAFELVIYSLRKIFTTEMCRQAMAISIFFVTV